MLRCLNNKKGQNTAEYAILIGIVVAAAIAMQAFVRRGLQAHSKDAIDFSMRVPNEAGEAAGIGVLFNTSQYDPYTTEMSSFRTEQAAKESEAGHYGGGRERVLANEYTSRTGIVVIGNWANYNSTF